MIEETILKHIQKLFGEGRGDHYSYCYAPFEPCSCIHLQEIGLDTELMAGGYIDSFSMVAVLFFLEGEFNISISGADGSPENFRTVRKMADLVRKNQ